MTPEHAARIYLAGAEAAGIVISHDGPPAELNAALFAQVLAVMAETATVIANEVRDTRPNSTVPLPEAELAGLRDTDPIPTIENYSAYQAKGGQDALEAWVARRRLRNRFGEMDVTEIAVTLRLMLSAPNERLAEAVLSLSGTERAVFTAAIAAAEATA